MKQTFLAAVVLCGFAACCPADVVTPPNSPPPQMVVVQRLDQRKHAIHFVQWEATRAIVTTVRHYQKKEGAEVPANVPLTTNQLTPHEHSLAWKNVRVLDAQGKQIASDDAWRRLRPGQVVYLATDPSGVDPLWRKALAHDSIILVPRNRSTPRPAESPAASPPAALPGK